MSATAPDNLAVIAHKIAAHTFDLSTQQREYSIRDQIVRGSLFGEGLATSAAYRTSGPSILIIGAGAAGIACGTRLASHGYEVHIFDAAKRPFALFAGATHRYVSPFIYEWPSVLSQQHSFLQGAGVLGSSGAREQFPSWESPEPLRASDLAVKLTEWLDAFLRSPQGEMLFIHTRASRDPLVNFATAFATNEVPPTQLSWPGETEDYSASVRKVSPLVRDSLEVACVILAAGAEPEKTHLFPHNPTRPFWTSDTDLLDAVAGKRIGVFGNGDGAFQDFLRYTFSCLHPLELFQSLPEKFQKQCAAKFAELLSIEIAAKRFSQWGGAETGDELIQQRCEQIVGEVASESRQQLVDALTNKLRADFQEVTLIRLRKAGKCYLLNRFMVALIEALQDELSAKAGRTIAVRPHEEHLKAGAFENGQYTIEVPGWGSQTFDQVIQRIGGDKEAPAAGRTVRASLEATGNPAPFCFGNLILPYEPFPAPSLAGKVRV